MKIRVPIFLLTLLWLSSCACDGETLLKTMMWSMNKLAGDGYFPSSEIMAIGNFERVEVNMQKSFHDGVRYNEVELRLINGRGPQLHVGEEIIARKVAEIYAVEFSKINEYDAVKITFIQTDPFNPDNLAMSEYHFRVEDLISDQNPSDYGLQ